MVLDEGDRVERIDARQPGVVEQRHVEGGGVVAHRREEVESEWEVERVATAPGPALDPALDLAEVAVEELADGELAAQRAEVEEIAHEVGGDSLGIVDPVALDVERRVTQSALASRPFET